MKKRLKVWHILGKSIIQEAKRLRGEKVKRREKADVRRFFSSHILRLTSYVLAFLPLCLFAFLPLVVATEDRGEEVPLTAEELTPTKEALKIKYINEEIPYLDANLDKIRNALSRTEPLIIELHRQDRFFPSGGGSIAQVEARGFHNGKWIYIGLGWDDITKDTRRLNPKQFADAVAIMFPVERPDEISPEKPFSPRMGKKGKTVNILQWRADWEEDLGSHEGLVGLKDEYPHMIEGYSDPIVDEVKEFEKTPLRQGGGRLAGNPLSQPDRGRSVDESNAEGFGTLTSQEHQDAFGSGFWQDGKWTVVIAKPLKTEDANDAQFEPGANTFINFAAWNGSEEDRNGQKSVSLMWHPIIIEK